MKAKLVVCASCEWVFKDELGLVDCPKCHFGAVYSARYAYGRDAYRFAKDQQPWFNKKIGNYADKLYKEIHEK